MAGSVAWGSEAWSGRKRIPENYLPRAPSTFWVQRVQIPSKEVLGVLLFDSESLPLETSPKDGILRRLAAL